MNMAEYSLVFLVGFCTNAIVWKFQQGEYDSIHYPAVVLILVVIMLIIRRR